MFCLCCGRELPEKLVKSRSDLRNFGFCLDFFVVKNSAGAGASLNMYCDCHLFFE